jgi:bifunctional non-homologous end joining protein LigD
MKNDRYGGSGKRTNWLLIKHRDEYARPGDHDALLAEDRSVSSGRPMAAIAAGKGRAPAPFMLAKKHGKTPAANAVWQSNRQDGGGGNPPVLAKSGQTGHARNARTRHAKNDRSSRSKSDTAARRQPGAPNGPKKMATVRQKSRPAPPDFIPPQLCKLVDRPPVGEGWGHEIKLDGYRLQLRVHDGKATLKTRKGLDWSAKFTALIEVAEGLPDCIIDGEVVAVNEHGVPDFAALQAALADDDSDNLVFFAFDLLFAQQEDLRRLPLSERKQMLEALFQEHSKTFAQRIRYLEHFETAGDAVLRSACQICLEGIVSKRMDAPYRSDRSGSWVKSKCRAGHEVVIGGWSSEEGSLRSLIVGVYKGNHLVPVGRVGTGFGREKVGPLLKRLKSLATKTNPFHGKVAVPSGRNINWVRPELVAEIEFAGWTEGGNVRQAVFKGLREDKPATEVRAEKPTLLPLDESSARHSRALSKSRVNSKPGVGSNSRGTASPSSDSSSSSKTSANPGSRVSSNSQANANPNSVMGVSISRPDKVLWPDAQDGRPVTKLDLALYFEAVGAWMLPHLQGRPCSIIRAPDGIDGQRFFQRHAMPGMSNLLDLLKVSGDRKAYVQINRIEGLIAVAQTAGLELHPGGCVPGKPDVPGRLVFDLDPAPDVDFGEVIKAALEVRARLSAIGLESFCKTTGGKGLHVVTPLSPSKGAELDWTVAKAFARELCRQMVEDAPQRYVLTMAKSDRTGHIFLDYLRNDRLSTAVAPLSPRARPGAPVSMPLMWSQVRQGLDPNRFTLRTAPDLLKRSKAWEDYDEGARPLAAAIEKLSNAARASPSAETASRPRASEPPSAGRNSGRPTRRSAQAAHQTARGTSASQVAGARRA